MRIIFPELDNPIIKEALAECPEVEAIRASSIQAGTEMLLSDEADSMIAGIEYPTRDFALACKHANLIKNKYFTSSFIFTKGNQCFILADGGICKNPDVEMMTEIVLQTYQTALKTLKDTPRLAMLSFSTFGSGGKDESIDLIHEVLDKIHAEHPEILIDGEMQLDVAISPRVAAKKAPNSEVAGRANVLICPDLNSGNILYKGLEQLGGWTVAGPIMQGFIKPISDLSRGSSVEDVVSTIKTIIKLGA